LLLEETTRSPKTKKKRVLSKKKICQKDERDLLKKIKKSPIKLKRIPLLAEISSVVSIVLWHCIFLKNEVDPKKPKRRSILTRPPKSELALASAK
jgi:hypothetical protein